MDTYPHVNFVTHTLVYKYGHKPLCIYGQHTPLCINMDSYPCVSMCAHTLVYSCACTPLCKHVYIHPVYSWAHVLRYICKARAGYQVCSSVGVHLLALSNGLSLN